MAKYTAGFRDKVKQDYLRGKFATLTDLAKAHKITNTQLISRWKKKEGWDDEFKALEEARTKAELESTSQNAGREIEEFREISEIHSTLWKAVVAQIATRFKRRDDGTMPSLNEGQLETLSRILLRAMEGQRKALGIDEDLGVDTAITINYPGLKAICENPDLFPGGREAVIDIPNAEPEK